jgi:hypothetical protein
VDRTLSSPLKKKKLDFSTCFSHPCPFSCAFMLFQAINTDQQMTILSPLRYSAHGAYTTQWHVSRWCMFHILVDAILTPSH